jgi:hypothetical protein
VAKGLAVNDVASVRETGETRKASHRGHKGGIKVGGERSAVNNGASVRETDETRKASHRGHAGHRGGLRLVAKGLR